MAAVDVRSNSVHQPNRVIDALFVIKMSDFEKGDRNINDSIDLLGSHISLKINQFPLQFRSDSSKKEFLKQSFLSKPWETEPINRMSCIPTSHFQMFVTGLAGSLQTNTEWKEISIYQEISTSHQGQRSYECLSLHEPRQRTAFS